MSSTRQALGVMSELYHLYGSIPRPLPGLPLQPAPNYAATRSSSHRAKDSKIAAPLARLAVDNYAGCQRATGRGRRAR